MADPKSQTLGYVKRPMASGNFELCIKYKIELPFTIMSPICSAYEPAVGFESWHGPKNLEENKFYCHEEGRYLKEIGGIHELDAVITTGRFKSFFIHKRLELGDTFRNVKQVTLLFDDARLNLAIHKDRIDFVSCSPYVSNSSLNKWLESQRKKLGIKEIDNGCGNKDLAEVWLKQVGNEHVYRLEVRQHTYQFS